MADKVNETKTEAETAAEVESEIGTGSDTVNESRPFSFLPKDFGDKGSLHKAALKNRKRFYHEELEKLGLAVETGILNAVSQGKLVIEFKILRSDYQHLILNDFRDLFFELRSKNCWVVDKNVLVTVEEAGPICCVTNTIKKIPDELRPYQQTFPNVKREDDLYYMFDVFLMQVRLT